ncbi:MAG TPA: GWxTD domain-containing protein [Terracidiphilus sp.]|nr:GWxTD domain-containing protein [Terracidiphilus sp.]
MRLSGRSIFVAAVSCALLAAPALAHHRGQDQDQSTQSTSQDQDSNPLHRPMSAKQRYQQQKELRQELKGPYKTWLNQDVVYIITDQERKAFLGLSNDEERDAFIEAFWRRRNPDPDSPENTAREEHYRRIAYANEHFAAGEPGWKTDRGRIYIEWGPPDSIDSHPSGGLYDRPADEGGGSTTTFPFEVWHYRYLPGLGENVNIEFVDTCMCGDYHFTLDPSEKDALLHVPGAGLTDWEQENHKDKTDRFKCAGVGYCGGGPMGDMAQGKEFDRIEMAAKLFAPPPEQFKDLDAFTSYHRLLPGPVLPFDVRTDFVKVTDNMDMVPITVQFNNRDITFVTKDGVSTGVLNILGKFTTLTDRTVQTFENQVEIQQPSELLQNELGRKSVYWKAIPLPPGLYRLDIVVKDVNNPDHIGIYGRGIEVPSFPDEKLGTSSLILADQMHQVPSSEIGEGNFVIGDMFIRPRVADGFAKPVIFKRDQPLSFWMQVYNLGIDQATRSNSATVTYEITDTANGDVILQKEMPSKDLGAHSDELTVDKTLPIAGLAPGNYKVTIKINDEISKQEIAQSAPFVVE